MPSAERPLIVDTQATDGTDGKSLVVKLGSEVSDLSEAMRVALERGTGQIIERFENAGGAVFDAVLPLLNTGARVPVCGLIAHYNATAPPEGPDRLPGLMRALLTRRIKMQGFIIFDDCGHRYGEFANQMGAWLI